MTTLDTLSLPVGFEKCRPVLLLFRDRCYATRTIGSTRHPRAGRALTNHEYGQRFYVLQTILLHPPEGYFCDAARTILRAAAGGQCLPAVAENATNDLQGATRFVWRWRSMTAASRPSSRKSITRSHL